MNDYKELIGECDEWVYKVDNFIGADDLANHIYACADAIEQLVAKLERATLRGEWQEVTLDRSIGKVKGFMCSKCGYEKIGRTAKPNYCPECGAKMFGDER